MFRFKLGMDSDDAAPYYRERWRNAILAVQRSGDWSVVKLDPEKMRAVDAEYGRQDWTHPLASALYWAHLGLSYSKTPYARAELREAICHTLVMEANADPRLAPRALAEMKAAMRERPSGYMKELIRGFSERHGLSLDAEARE